MPIEKPRSLRRLEERLGDLEPGSLRYQVLDSARRFKSSWIELGRYLYTAHRDRLYKEWGHLTFEAYCAKEIGIRRETAVKLLRSYFFLEKEEPQFLRRKEEDPAPSKIPSYESVNALRLAKMNERIPEKQYAELREAVLDEAREEGEVKKKIRYILQGGPARHPVSNGMGKKLLVRRLIRDLENARATLGSGLPPPLAREMQALTARLSDYERSL